MIHTIEIIKPDDWHCHFRQGEFLNRTVLDSAKRFRRAVAMPNLQPPVTTVEQALNYQQQLHCVLPSAQPFTFLMVLYLTENTSVEEIAKIKHHETIVGVKYYPAGATTHSEYGVKKIETM